ncbi:N-acetyltransferase [Mastigocladus laminosus UU774]|nr:GNAT family N-acetyltransferase [Westiellopsis prolifica IICB1]TFI53835.1 N-acetyltransferase [Mastigocladus laminosus UU774]
MSSIYPLLETQRLILRDFVESDWQAVHAYACDLEVVRYLPFGPNSEEDTKNYLHTEIKSRRKKIREHFTFAIALKADKQVIGSCRISITDRNKQEGSIGYCLGREFWGQGYATEVARKLLEFGFKQLSLHRVFALCHPKNKASMRVLIKIGMRQEGYLREYEWSRGEWQDRLLFAMLDREMMQMQLLGIETEKV